MNDTSETSNENQVLIVDDVPDHLHLMSIFMRKAGYKVAEMPVNHRARRFGTSKYGAMNRAFRGLADCLAVRWMGSRMLTYKITSVYPSHSEGSSEPPR